MSQCFCLDMKTCQFMQKREGVVMCANFVMRVEAGGGERTKTREKLGRGEGKSRRKKSREEERKN